MELTSSLRQSAARAIITTALWVGCVLLSFGYTREAGGVAIVWPASAILATALLIEGSGRRWLPVTLVAMASLLLHFLDGLGPWMMLGFTVARVGESVLTAWLIAKFVDLDRLFDAPREIFRFTVAVILGCIPSALLVGEFVRLSEHGDRWLPVVLRWIPSHVCGLLILTPMLLLAGRLFTRGRSPAADRIRLLQGCGVLGIVAAVSLFVFLVPTYPMSFLILPPLLAATFTFRAPGAAMSVVVIVITALLCTLWSDGPLPQIDAPVQTRALLLQLFLATAFLCALPLAAVLNERDRIARQATRHLTNLSSVATHIAEVLFRVDDEGRWVYLSPSYEALTGRKVDAALGRHVLGEVPPADHDRLFAKYEKLRSGEVTDIVFSTTLVNASGQRRDIEASMFRVMIEEGQSFGIGGILRDVTAQKHLEAQLQNRAEVAQQAAQKSERDALTDQLTGLPNRRAFLEHLGKRLEQRRSFTLALFDIDHFKRINDGHGHLAGDEVLRRLAAIVSGHLSGRSVVARIGGEEFAVLIDGMTPAGGIGIAHELIEVVRSSPILVGGHVTDSGQDAVIPVTISMGLATRRADNSADELLAAADRALYAAKNGGRNQLRLAA